MTAIASAEASHRDRTRRALTRQTVRERRHQTFSSRRSEMSPVGLNASISSKQRRTRRCRSGRDRDIAW